MANKNIEQFIATYGPVAVQVANEINVDPNVLLSQWGMESRWGQSVPASFNVGGIKDFSGTGEKGKDNKTGSVDKYLKFEDPEVFGMYYADLIKRNFPKAVGTGDDVGAFSRGLSEGKRGSYFEIPATDYEQAIANAKAALPSNLPFSPKEQNADGDMVPGAAPPPKPPAPDTSGASRAEQFLFGGVGAGRHGTGRATAHADAHARAAQLHQQGACREFNFVGEARVDTAQAAGNHDGLVVAAHHPVHHLLVLAEVARQVGPAKLVVESRTAQGALGHDLQRAGDVRRLAMRGRLRRLPQT